MASVLVVGAGLTGLFAAAHLKTNGFENVQILEARDTYGGRAQEITNLDDGPALEFGSAFPFNVIDLEALDENNPYGSSSGYETITFDPDAQKRCTVQGEDESVVSCETIQSPGEQDGADDGIEAGYEKLADGKTIFSYLEDYIYPELESSVVLNEAVETIDYSSCDSIIVTAESGNTYTVDKVIVAVGASVMSNIEFTPPLPESHADAISSGSSTAALRAWIKFSERFYEDLTTIEMAGIGRLDFTDARFDDDSQRFILTYQGLDDAAERLVEMDDDTIFQTLMTALDAAYDGAAANAYVEHVIQNWSKEPYIMGGIDFFDNDEDAAFDALLQPIQGRIYIGGDVTETVQSAGVNMAQRIVQYPETGCNDIVIDNPEHDEDNEEGSGLLGFLGDLCRRS